MDQTAYFEQMRRKRKAEILAEAEKMILKYGLNTFSMQNLAKNLDISTVTLYNYFKNSDAIVDELQEHLLEQVISLLDAMIPENNTLENILNFISKIIYTGIIENRNHMTLLFLFQMHRRYNENYQEDGLYLYKKTLIKKMENLLEAARQDGTIDPETDPAKSSCYIVRLTLALIREIVLAENNYCQTPPEEELILTQEWLETVRLYLYRTAN